MNTLRLDISGESLCTNFVVTLFRVLFQHLDIFLMIKHKPYKWILYIPTKRKFRFGQELTDTLEVILYKKNNTNFNIFVNVVAPLVSDTYI